MEKEITGVMIYYYEVCKRKLWYFYNEIQMEQGNEDVLIGKAIDEETYNRLSKSSVKKHAKGHFISRAKMLQCIPVRVWVENPKAYAATIIRFGQVSSVLKKNFYERRQACGGIITACLSYLAIFMPLNDGGGTEAA